MEPVPLCEVKALLCTTKYCSSTTPALACTAKYYSTTTLYYTQYYSSTTKVLPQYYPVLESTSTTLDSSTTLHDKAAFMTDP